MDPDENRPWPDRSKAQAWWEGEKRHFAEDVRYLRGLPKTQESCREILKEGYQAQRRAAAYELALIDPGRHLWNWRARASVQTKRLGSS